MIGLIIGVIVSLLFSAFFSGMEIAFVSSNKLLAEMDREDKNGLPQKVIHRFYLNSNNYISTMLVGNNIALVIYGIFIAKLFDQTIFAGMPSAFTVPADTILSTLIVLFTGEFLPKTLFKINPNHTLTIFAIPAYLIYVLLFPISRITTILAHGVLKLFHVKIDKGSTDMEFSKVDLDYLVKSTIDNSKNVEDEVKIFHNALDFSDTKVRDCMIPRTEIIAVEIHCKIEELLDTFIESGKSKVIIYEDDLDHILGYIHSSELFRLTQRYKISKSGIPEASMELKTVLDNLMINEMPIVPEIMAAHKLMTKFRQEKKTLGIVVDEFGGTSGIVALEDLMEEIFGEIEDEHDSSNLVAQKDENNEYLLSARMEIAKVNEMFGLDLPENDDYLTIGGLILHSYASFPKINEIVVIGQYEFKIIKKTMTKIELVKLKVGE